MIQKLWFVLMIIFVSKLVSVDIDWAYNGLEALELIKVKKYDLILSDINMSLCNGFELVQSIRQSGNKVGIFMITTEGGRDEELKL